MRLKDNTIAIELHGHGLFVSSLDAVGRCAQLQSYALAKRIAQCYEGCDDRKKATVAYWRAYPRYVLAIVYAGMIEPRDDFYAAPVQEVR